MNDGYGALMRALRQRAGKTQEEMAEQLNVDQATISRVENGRQEPGINMIDRWGQITKSKEVIAVYLLDSIGGANVVQYLISQKYSEMRQNA